MSCVLNPLKVVIKGIKDPDERTPKMVGSSESHFLGKTSAPPESPIVGFRPTVVLAQIIWQSNPYFLVQSNYLELPYWKSINVKSLLGHSYLFSKNDILSYKIILNIYKCL